MTIGGSGSFGHFIFNDSDWSKEVLFGLIPPLYKEADADNGGLLEAFIDGIRGEFEDIRENIQNYGDIRDPLKARTSYDDVFPFKLGKQLKVAGEIQQRGLDGKVTSIKNFSTKTGRFRTTDLGSTLTITKSSVLSNNTTVTITKIIDSQTVLTDPLLTEDPGPLFWELRGKPPAGDGLSRFEIRSGDASELSPDWLYSDGTSQFTLASRNNFQLIPNARRHLTEAEGADGTVDTVGRVVVASGPFSQLSLGKKISIHGSAVESNNGWSEIVYVANSTTAATSLLEIQGNAIAASVTIPGTGPNGGVVYTAAVPGAAGNAITVTQVQTGTGTVLSVSVTGTAITVVLATDGGGAITSTAQDVEAAVNASVPAAALVVATFTGTGLGLAGAAGVTPLTGGKDYGTVRYFLKPTVQGVRVFQKDPSAVGAALTVSVSNQDITVSLGTDGGGAIISTGADVVAAVNNNPSASLLVAAAAEGLGDGTAGAVADFLPVIGVGLGHDLGPFDWAVLPFAIIALEGNIVPQGVVEQDGLDGTFTQITPSITFMAATGKFAPTDVGKVISIRGSINPVTNSTFKITAAISPNAVTVAPLSGTNPIKDSGLFWELRVPTVQLDRLSGFGSAPSILTYLAQDFGIEIDEHENADRQRSYVSSCNQWFDLKGTVDSYEILGALSGIVVNAYHLYRVTKEIYVTIPAGDKYEVPEAGAGKSGAIGTLTIGSDLKLIFTSSTAAFDAADVGRDLKIAGSSFGGNNKYYTIDTVLSPTSIKLAFGDTATTPDTLSGVGTKWSVVRLYSDLAPTRPLYDEINSDELTTWVAAHVPGKVFSVDKYCWESDFAAYVDITVNSVTLLTFGVYTVNVTGPADVIVAVGHWQLEYPDGTQIAVETVPVPDGFGGFNFTIKVTAPTATGAAKLRYTCDPVLTCDYCGSYRVVAIIEYSASSFATPKEFEDLQNRIINRLMQIVPIHVEMIPIFKLVSTVHIGVHSHFIGGM